MIDENCHKLIHLKFELAYASAYASARDGDAQLQRVTVYSSLCLLIGELRETVLHTYRLQAVKTISFDFPTVNLVSCTKASYSITKCTIIDSRFFVMVSGEAILSTENSVPQRPRNWLGGGLLLPLSKNPILALGLRPRFSALRASFGSLHPTVFISRQCLWVWPDDNPLLRFMIFSRCPKTLNVKRSYSTEN